MPLHPPITLSKPLRILNKGLGAVLLCVVSSAAWAQPAPVPPASSVCEPGEDWPRTLECLREKTGFIDIALQDSLRQLHEKLPTELRESLQTQQDDWEQRRDRDCTPTDRPASDSNALAYAMLCRSKMALQRNVDKASFLAQALQCAGPIFPWLAYRACGRHRSWLRPGGAAHYAQQHCPQPLVQNPQRF